MKKTFFAIAIGVLTTSAGFAQKQFTRSANISFFSDTPMEKIEATNQQATSVVELEKNEMVFSVLMKSFEFEKALMQEHFNEKYVESDKFPKAQFKGTYKAEKAIDLKKDGTYPVTVSGTMNMHGVDKEVKATGTFTVKGGKLSGKSEFNLKLADYNINIPGVVKDNIAEQVKITVDATYEPYTK
jgi:polyisoprenoid-binding protein YceI